MAAADAFPAVFHRAQAFVGRVLAERGPATRACFLTCGDWDLRTMLPAQCRLLGLPVPPPFAAWCNIKHPFRDWAAAQPGGVGLGRLGMAGMLEFLGLPLVGRHHSGLDDARNIAAIAWALIQRGVVLDRTGELSARQKRRCGGYVVGDGAACLNCCTLHGCCVPLLGSWQLHKCLYTRLLKPVSSSGRKIQ